MQYFLAILVTTIIVVSNHVIVSNLCQIFENLKHMTIINKVNVSCNPRAQFIMLEAKIHIN